MRMRINILSVILISYFTACVSSKKADSNFSNPTSFFSGYNFLNVPNDSLKVGSEWSTATHSAEQSKLTEKDLVITSGPISYNIDNDKTLQAKMEVKFANYFGLNSQISSGKTFNLHLKSIKITTVKNLSIFNFASNQIFIMEAVSIDSFSIIAEKEILDSIHIKLNKLSTKIEPQFEIMNNRKMNIHGLKLYIAYKLVQFGEAEINRYRNGCYNNQKRKHQADYVITRNHSEDLIDYKDGIAISQNKKQLDNFKIEKKKDSKDQCSYNTIYDGTIHSFNSFNRLFTEKDKARMLRYGNSEADSCQLYLIIQCYSEFTEGKPKCIRIDINCKNMETEEYPIIMNARLQGSYYEIDELVLKIDGYEYNKNKKMLLPIDDGKNNVEIEYIKKRIPITTFFDR
jgi:hypothetical protein